MRQPGKRERERERDDSTEQSHRETDRGEIEKEEVR